MTPPDLPYAPPLPRSYRPRIGVIGTGGISDAHLDAYRTAGWEVAALWNRTRATAEAKGAEFCPAARIEEVWQAILADPGIDVVDVTLHPEHRVPILRAAIDAGKHVLSQKPFVTDLDVGEDLARRAEDRGVRLAVNQNGRWAPHMAWMREAVAAGHIGTPLTAHVSVHWDHGWTAGTPFDRIEDLLLYDFGVHWFDFLCSLFGDRIEAVTATAARATGQKNAVPLLAQALLRIDGGQASVAFDGATPVEERDTTTVTGTDGLLSADGPALREQSVRLTTAAGTCHPTLNGTWFNDGFRGAMGELLCAIEDARPPLNDARGNLRSLAVTFAAVTSRREGREVAVGDIRRLEDVSI